MRSFRSFSIVVLAVYALLVVAPIAAFLVTALRGATAEAWAELWRTMTATRLLRNSLALAALTAGTTLLVGVPLGYLLARTDVPAARALLTLTAVPLFLPPFLWATAWLFGVGSVHGFGGAWFVMTVSLCPIVALLAGVGFAHVDPTMEEDCRTIAGEWRVFWHVALPLARPLIVTGALLVFVVTLSEFGVPALMQVNVYPVAIVTAFAALNDFGQAAALCVPLLVTAGLAAWTLGTRGADFTSLAESWQARRIALGKARWTAAVVTFVLLAAALGVPLGALVQTAVTSNQSSVTSISSSLVTGHWSPVTESLCLATIGAGALTALTLPVAWLCQRRYTSGGARWLAVQPVLFALPSAVVGLGLVCLWNHPALTGFYRSSAMIVLGYIARFAPLLTVAFAAFLAQLPRDCEEAIWVDGGGVGVTFTCFIVPASRRAMAALGLLGFVLCFGELATTILVSPPGVQTLAVRLFTIEANAPRAATANLALLMMSVCFVPVLVGLTLRARLRGA